MIVMETNKFVFFREDDIKLNGRHRNDNKIKLNQ